MPANPFYCSTRAHDGPLHSDTVEMVRRQLQQQLELPSPSAVTPLATQEDILNIASQRDRKTVAMPMKQAGHYSISTGSPGKGALVQQPRPSRRDLR